MIYQYNTIIIQSFKKRINYTKLSWDLIKLCMIFFYLSHLHWPPFRKTDWNIVCCMCNLSTLPPVFQTLSNSKYIPLPKRHLHKFIHFHLVQKRREWKILKLQRLSKRLVFTLCKIMCLDLIFFFFLLSKLQVSSY